MGLRRGNGTAERLARRAGLFGGDPGGRRNYLLFSFSPRDQQERLMLGPDLQRLPA